MGTFTDDELAVFHRDGFVKIPGLVDESTIDRILEYTDRASLMELGPIEYESDLGYPGAPESRDAPGGRTIRRLLQAIGRETVFSELATHPEILTRLRQILGKEIVLPLAHHNCIMVKAPRYGTATDWHQDIRYWRFEKPELVTVLLALNDATVKNGCLHLIPGSHHLSLCPEQLDEDQFLIDSEPTNKRCMANSKPVLMSAGDVVFFHCRTFHSAGSNQAGAARKSVLFTYRAANNPPLPGSRSAGSPELLLHP